MQADAVVLLGGENIDVPPTWIRPGAAIIRCEPNLETGRHEHIASKCEQAKVKIKWQFDLSSHFSKTLLLHWKWKRKWFIPVFCWVLGNMKCDTQVSHSWILFHLCVFCSKCVIIRLSFNLDDHAIGLTSKCGLGYLAAAYRAQVCVSFLQISSAPSFLHPALVVDPISMF